MSNSLCPHGLQRARPPCPSPTPRVHSNSCPLSQCCHPTISSSVVPFSSHLQSFPASGSFQMSLLFASSGQCTVVVAQSLVVSSSSTPWTEAHQGSLPFTICRSLLKLMSIESLMPSKHLILCHPLLLLPPIPPSIRVFSNESTLCTRWPKYWSFSFRIILSKEYPGLISFRMY